MSAKTFNYFGYVLALLCALIAGWLLVRSGANLLLVLSLSGSAWAGGIFFLMIKQRLYEAEEAVHES